MFNILRVRFRHGQQAIKNIRKAVIKNPYRGFPQIQPKPCINGCECCFNRCPAQAITLNPFQIDLGKCVTCGACLNICPEDKIHFSNFHKTAVTTREKLFIQENTQIENFYQHAIQTRQVIHKIFSRSLKLRQVSAGGCNACEMELNACSNVNFDMGRFGIDIVASPRHADGIIITGPISENMAAALLDTYQAVAEPKIVILAGSCAISGGVFKDSDALKRDFLNDNPVDLYIPGCPVHPLTVINGILDFLGRRK